jgi:hypothetical protein
MDLRASSSLLLACCCWFLIPIPSGGAVSDFPGRNPGPAHLALEKSTIVCSNAVLVASWQLGQDGFQRTSARDLQGGREMSFRSPAFKVVLADGQVLDSSKLAPASDPKARKFLSDMNSVRLAGRFGGCAVEIPFKARSGGLEILWRAVAHDDSAYIREELELVSPAADVVVREIVWQDQPIPNARQEGTVDGSIIRSGNFFFGYEDPMAANRVDSGAPNGAVTCKLVREAKLLRGQRLAQSHVVGVVPEGQSRRGFLHYLERERAHPYRPFLHYNSWYDIAWHPFALNETNCLEAIRVIGERFIRAHKVTVDAMVFDDGWDNPRSLWQFHAGFPRGFAPLAELCKSYNTRLGVWLSPFGGYGESKEQRLKFGAAQGYETNATGFSLAGPKYFEAFKQSCVGMIREYGVNHFKFDGIASGMYANGSGADYILDTEAMRRLMLQLRKEDPKLYINLTTGSWPSPFWLLCADSIWRQGGDMGHAGKGSKQQQWLTYRDQEVFRNIVTKGPLFPLSSLMSQGVAYSREGMAGDPTFDAAGFKDDLHAFFGSGTGLQELYLQPDKLTAADWAVLAEAAKWSRANADVLADTHWVGGDPSKLEVYGYASWSPRKGTLTLRNPDDRPQAFMLDPRAAFELPADAPPAYALRSPWKEDREKPVLEVESGKPIRLALKPFEVLAFDATPLPTR